jgi:PTS system mannose-specific IID component
MGGLTHRGRALFRLAGIQASWSYERMQGVGLGHALEPLLEDTLRGDGTRSRAALARATGFFNANPYLAAAAAGAEARVEADGVPGPQIERLRTALCGPLGALGDRLFWTGLVPALASAAIAAVALGAGLWPIVVFVVLHNLLRTGLGLWLLQLGWDSGLHLGGAINASFLPRAGTVVERLAAFLGGAALPIAAVWLFRGSAMRADLAGVAVLMVGLLLLRRVAGARTSALMLTLVVGAAVIIWQWGTA